MDRYTVTSRTFRSDRNARLLAAKEFIPRQHSSVDGAFKGYQPVTLLLVHATGFHKEQWEPILETMPLSSDEAATGRVPPLAQVRECDHFANENAQVFLPPTSGTAIPWHIDRVVTIDAWNHGDSTILNREKLVGKVPTSPSTWISTGADVVEVVAQMQVTSMLVGMGHSFGATSILLAEIIRPALFDAILSVEAVLAFAMPQFSLANFDYVLKRKATWPSAQHASQYIANHQFFSGWDPRAIGLYQTHGMTTTVPPAFESTVTDNPDLAKPETVYLKCHPRDECATFTGGLVDGRWARRHLGEIVCPVRFLLADNSITCFNDRFAQAHANCAMLSDARVARQSSHLLPMESPSTVSYEMGKFIGDTLAVRLALQQRARL
ncbi:hypothetical protein IWQ60_009087 [Tieghemiomyces parasiticus]|uniref:AB hydrolase-1 domain-containing protein n=1 Tax=Tieghemiomyces parasiticus TaxID=78921 RepID=A0A9W8DLR6_9FUNG|nr:hypothetical protein IWQ60_009087 [Tieghemiomyces parasiticus]